MTNLDNVELAVRLADLAAEPAPPPRFDPAASITAGRSRLRRRRRTVAAAVATAAAVTALLLLTPAGGPSSLRLVPAAPPHGEQGQDMPQPVPTSVGSPSDPLVVNGSFGWLPDWLDRIRNVGYETGQEGAVARASLPGSAGPSLTLSVFPGRTEPPLTDNALQQEAKAPAQPVNGRTAYWVTNPTHPTYDSGQRMLRWQTADGHWAQLVSNRPQGTDIPDDVLLHVASGVMVGEQPVQLPFWLSDLPAGTRVTSASLVRPANGQPWMASADLWLDGKTLGIFVLPVGEQRYGKPDTQCREEQGLQICATAESDQLPLDPRFGDLNAVTRLVHATGPTEVSWTTEVIR